MTVDVVDALQALADVLAQEDRALRRLDFPAAASLFPDKDRALQRLTRDGGLASAIGTSRSRADLARQLVDLTTRNQSLLKQAAAIQARVLEVLIQGGTTRPVNYDRATGARRLRLSSDKWVRLSALT